MKPLDYRYKARGRTFRVQSDDNGDFDEIVVVHGKPPKAGCRESGLVVHVEAMGRRSYFCDIAGLCAWVFVDESGVARITMTEDRRPCALAAMPDLRDPRLDDPPPSRPKRVRLSPTKGGCRA